MALVKGENSYVDVSEADAYFSTRLGSAAWVDSDEAAKEAALVTATRVLDDMEWMGLPYSPVQVLAFPRRIQDIAEPTPVRFVRAVFEMALHLLQNPELMMDTGGVESLSVGPISLTNISNPRLIPQYVERLIAPYTLSSGLLSTPTPWWRAW